jgi:hypothetical protein
MRRALRIYEVIGPAIALPLALAAWVMTAASWHVAVLAVAVPVIHAYVVPVIGAGYLGMWRINSPLAPNGYRWHHGFVFGSATALLAAVICAALSAWPEANGPVGMAVAVGITLLAVNWIYDALALRAGVLEVFNQPWADGRTCWLVAADYAIWFFGLFGVIYGAGLGHALVHPRAEPSLVGTLGVAVLLSSMTIAVPSACYVAASYLRHGHSGCRPFPRRIGEGA